MIIRLQKIKELFPEARPFRLRQMEKALFTENFEKWEDVTTLSKPIREILEKDVPWTSCSQKVLQASRNQETFKAVLDLEDKKSIETVLMQNSKGFWTICVSCQIGCAMKCRFCSTGKMGFIRDLSSDEIIDQYRYWKNFLKENSELSQHISNIVYMGMGEPMANYENVKKSINTILEYTDIGPTHISVSTVGILSKLEELVEDDNWPPVRMAISLHSANSDTRKDLMPSSYDDFLEKLEEWCSKYLEKLGTRSHYITFEYLMLEGINDSPEDAQKLINFFNNIGHAKINIIPYNFTDDEFRCSSNERMNQFMDILRENFVNVTRRRSMGDDIGAACGQLITENE